MSWRTFSWPSDLYEPCRCSSLAMILRRVDLESLDLESRSLRSTGDATASATAAGWAVSSLDICLGWGVEDVELERTESDWRFLLRPCPRPSLLVCHACGVMLCHGSWSPRPPCLANRFAAVSVDLPENSAQSCMRVAGLICPLYGFRRMVRKCFLNGKIRLRTRQRTRQRTEPPKVRGKWRTTYF